MKTFHNTGRQPRGLLRSRTALLVISAAAMLALAAGAATASPQKEKSTPAAGAATNSASEGLVASSGVLISGVQAGGPADKAGIVRGDIILEADGKAVNTPGALQAAIDAKKSGDTLALKVKHGDAEKTVTVTLTGENGRAFLGIIAAGPNGAGRMLGGRFGFGMGNGPNNGFNDGRFGMMGPGGAYVADVVDGGPAQKAGIVQGDVILSMDGKALDGNSTLADLIAAKKVGDTVTLSVQSAGQAQPHDVKVTLDQTPNKDTPRLGLQYSMVGPRGRLAPGFGRGGPGVRIAGVFVADVAADGPAAKAGIKAQDVITKVDGAAVTDPQQVVDAVGKHKPGDTIPVSVARAADGSSADLTVTLGVSPTDAAKAYLGVSMGPGFQRFQLPPAAPQGSMTGAETPTL